MSENKALFLTFATFSLVTAVAFAGLTFAGAKDSVLTVAIFLIACVGAHVTSRVVMHYPPPDERRR